MEPTLDESTVFLNEFYESCKRAGFNDEQAFRLTLAGMESAKNQGDQNE